MQDLLCVETADISDSISIFGYISQLRSNFLLQHELEALCKKLYNCLKNIELIEPVEIILTYLVKIETQYFIKINGFLIHIRDKWFFKLILLASLKHSKELFNKKNNIITIHSKHKILQQAMLTFRADKIESILILRLIENVIKKHKNIMDSTLAVELLFFSQKVAISPFEGYKSYAHSISKTALLVLDLNDIKGLLNLHLLPVRGVETLELVPYFKQVHKNVYGNIVTKVIQMFSNNIENREGGFLYKTLLFEDFSYWREVVWPQFCTKFQTVDFEGEFFQSLVKYWIPQCVSTYKVEFYTFIFAEPICRCLKGHILLETRRRGLIEDYQPEMIYLISKLFEDDTLKTLALKIVSSCFKRNIYPCNIELQLVNRYLYGHTGTLDNEELKCLHMFLSQIGVVGSDLSHLKVRSPYQEQQLAYYKNYVMNLFKYCLKSLRSSNRNIAAQILVVFWKLKNDDSPYLLNYKLDTGGVGFFSSIFQEKRVHTDLIKKVLLESDGNFPEMTELGRLISFSNEVYTNDFLLKFVEECTELNSIMVAESVKNISYFIVSQNKPKENLSLLQNLFDAVSKHFQHFFVTLKSIFKGVLLLEAVLAVSKNVHSQEACKFEGFDMYCLPVIESLLGGDVVNQIYQNEITEKGHLDCVDQQYNLFCKIQKILESLFNNMLLYMMQDPSIWHFVDKPKIMNLLVKIIKTSNMRRPTTVSADVLKHIAKLTDEGQKNETPTDINLMKKRNEDVSYKIKLLHHILQKLFEVASVQNLTIRRNPESRLVIHALCQSDTHPQKPFLRATLIHLLKILTDPDSTDPTISSAMHCTEILISDNTLYNHTLRFVPEIMLHCVEHFKNRNWVVRNANIQLVRSLIDRCMGVLIGPNNRPKSAEDLFCLFPQLITTFCQTLIQEPLTDSAVIVLQVFSESQTKRQPIKSECMETVKEIFLRLFVRIIKKNPDQYGIFAARAFTSLCLEEQIPEVITDVITFITRNFTYINDKHSIRNFVHLLSELYDKFLGYIEDFPVKPGSYFQIHANFDVLSMFLKPLKIKQFDLLLVKVLSVDEVMTTLKTSNFDVSDHAQRLWQHNYIALLFIDIEADLLGDVLKEVLSKNILECIQVKILSILVDRYHKNQFSCEAVDNILGVLLEKTLLIDDNRKYLIVCYFKVIFLFFKRDRTLKIGKNYIKQMRFVYTKVRNVQKMFVFILILAQVSYKNDCDKKFIKTAVRYCQKLDLTNFEIAEILSQMLPYLFISVYCICDKYRVFKIAAFLIVEHGLYDFVNFVGKFAVSSPLFAMIALLDFEFLVKSFDGYEVAYRFVKEFYDYVVLDYVKNSKSNNKTYYVEEKNIFVDRILIDKIVLKFLRYLNRKQGNLEWFRHYELLQSQNKR